MSDDPSPEPTGENIDWTRIQMLDGSDPAQSEPNPDRGLPLVNADWDSNDAALVSVLFHVEFNNYTIGITLFVEGAIISGTAISGEKYYEDLVREFEERPEGTVEFSLERSFREFQQQIADKPDSEETKFYFLHLKGAKTYIPGKRGMPSNGALMRVHVNAISAWHIGALQTPSEEAEA